MNVPLERNLEATYRWLCSAQDVTVDGGVAGWYHFLKGWSASYPETTGYIIPTFLTYAATMSKPEARDRAFRMADWEIEVQMSNGAVQSGILGRGVEPSVFNTGQVLFGWVAAYQATGAERYASAIKRAAEWLVQGQDEDGAWRKDLSSRTTSGVQTYNVRAAWGLAAAGAALGEAAWLNAARKNCDWALTQQGRNGWFAHNTFYEKEIPLLHTIGYVLEGLLGVGEILKEEKYINAVRLGAKPLMDLYRNQRALKGRYDRNWRNAVYWRCPAGEAQIAVVLFRLAKYFPNENGFREVALQLVEDLGRVQDAESPFRESNGGIGGSEPLWGGYCPLTYVSWAAKFYLDALLLGLHGADVQGPS